MATKLFLKQFNNSGPGLTAYKYASLTQSVLAFITSVTRTTASGTKIQATDVSSGTVLKWISPPVAVPFTLSGTVTFNLWAKEATTSVNVTVSMELAKYSGGSEGASFVAATFGSPTELTATIGAKNWTGSPSSTTFNVGDRIVAYIYIVNVGTMGASASGATTDYGGKTAAADGDSWFQLNETITFQPEPEIIQFSTVNGGSRSFDGVVTSGNAVAAIITWGPQSVDLNSITDGTNTYALLGSRVAWHSTSFYGRLAVVKNVTGGSALTVTPNFSGATSYVGILIVEIAGVDLDPLDDISAQAGTSGTFDTGSIATRNAREILIAGFDEATGGGTTVGSNYVLRTNTALTFEDREVEVAGSYNAQVTVASQDYFAGLIALKAKSYPFFPPLLPRRMTGPEPHILTRF